MKQRNYRQIHRQGRAIMAQTCIGCSPMVIAMAIDEDAARDIIDALEARKHTKDLNDYNTPVFDDTGYEECETCYDSTSCDACPAIKIGS